MESITIKQDPTFAEPSQPRAGTFINRSLRTALSVLLVLGLISICFGTGRAGSSNSSIHREHRNQYDRVRSSPTFVLERNFHMPGDTRTLTFLFDNLNVSGDLLRVWNLGHFEVTKEEDRLYRATKGDDLAGTCYQLSRKPGRVVFVGEGIYRPDHSPIDVPGTAVVSIEWMHLEKQRLELDVRLMLQPDSWLVRWLGTLLHPLVRPPLKTSFNKLIERGPRLMSNLRSQPGETLRRLSEHHPETAPAWERFLEDNPGYPSPTPVD